MADFVPQDGMEMIEQESLGDGDRLVKVAVASREEDGQITVKEIEGVAAMAVTTNGMGEHHCMMIGGIRDHFSCFISLLNGMVGRVEGIAKEDFLEGIQYAVMLKTEIDRQMGQLITSIFED